MQVPGTNVKFEFAEQPMYSDASGIRWAANAPGKTTKVEFSSCVGQRVENPEGILCEIKDVEVVLCNAFSIDPALVILTLDPLEKPF